MKNNLTTIVTNILLKRVTEEEAKDYALNHFGELCTYIRQRFMEDNNIVHRLQDKRNVFSRGAGKKRIETVKINNTTQTFKNWKEVTTYSYRLALNTNKEVKVTDSKGTEYNYSPFYAEEYLRLLIEY